MKKILSFLTVILTIMIALQIIILNAYAEDNFLSARALSDFSEYISGYKVTFLSESTAIKKSELRLASDEMLYIRKNVTLSLYKNSVIDGIIYIENGGKLLLAGGEAIFSNSGMILSDGTLSINKKVTFTVKDGAEVFIGKNGKLRVTNDKSLNFDELANAVCIGSTNSKCEFLGRTPAAAYIRKNGTLNEIKSPSAALPDGAEDYCTNSVISENLQEITFFFDNGATVKVRKNGKYFSKIGKCPVSIIGMKQKNEFSGISYSRIYQINGNDYVYDMNGIADVIIDNDRITNDYASLDNKAMKKALKNFSKDKYIGKFSDSDADMYLNSDNSILVIWKSSDDGIHYAARLVQLIVEN